MNYLERIKKEYKENKPKYEKTVAITDFNVEYYSTEISKFEAFLNSDSGIFDGFDFVNIFHELVKKEDAIFTCEADDCALASTPFGIFYTGADGITAYFFSETPKKQVNFNRSVYFF